MYIIQVNLWQLTSHAAKNWRILLQQSFTVHMLLMMANSAFGLGRRRQSSPRWCYRYRLRTVNRMQNASDGMFNIQTKRRSDHDSNRIATGTCRSVRICIDLAGIMGHERADPAGLVWGEGGSTEEGFGEEARPIPQNEFFAWNGVFLWTLSGIFLNLGTICISVPYCKFRGTRPFVPNSSEIRRVLTKRHVTAVNQSQRSVRTLLISLLLPVIYARVRYAETDRMTCTSCRRRWNVQSERRDVVHSPCMTDVSAPSWPCQTRRSGW